MERNSIDFNKGCYLGQEVMARLHSMGKVQKQKWQLQYFEKKNIFPTSLPLGFCLRIKQSDILNHW